MAARTKKPLDRPVFNNPEDLVTFVIGEGDDVHKFIIHREVAYYHSDTFRAGLAGAFEEAGVAEYQIDDTTKEVFKMMVQFMYREDIELKSLKKDAVYTMEWDTECENLVDLWVLGQRYLMPRLQNYIMDKIAFMFDKEKEDDYVPAFLLGYIYDNTPDGCRLRRFIADQYACVVDFDREALDDCPKEALVDVLQVLKAYQEAKYPRPASVFYVEAPDDELLQDA